MKIELAHDLLAKKIHEKASQEDRKLLEIRQFIQQRFAHFKKNQVLLARDDLIYIKPYVGKLSLKPHELRFIQLSKDRLLYYGIAVGVLTGLVVGIIAYFALQNDRIQEKSRQQMAAQLARYEVMNAHAQELSDSLVKSQEGLTATKAELRLALLALQAKNDTLVDNYARYKVEQNYSKKQLEQELAIAQSSKLSELAAATLETDRRYAFQLADKAWHLNANNEQAMRVLHEIAEKPYQSNASKQYTYKIVKKCRSNWGTLNSKEVEAIFNPTNNITAQSKAPVNEQVKKVIKKPAPPPSSKPPADLEEEVQVQRLKIQQEVQDVKLDIQQQRDQIQQQQQQLQQQRPRLNGRLKPE